MARIIVTSIQRRLATTLPIPEEDIKMQQPGYRV
jgi:hypothetical protein